jgi:hypothetical protein
MSAGKLTTARTINGISFDGTANIVINAVDSTSREPSIAAGLSTQYWRGDKTWQTLDKGTIGLSNVDNISDVDKPISTLVQTELDLKSATGHKHVVSDITDTIALKYTKSTTQALSSNTATKLTFPTVVHNFGNCWTTTAPIDRFIPPVAISVGIYRVACQIRFTSTATGWLAIYKNGVLHQKLDDRGINMTMFSGYTDINLVATDYLEIYAQTTAARTIQVIDSYIQISSIY